jgi:hypothetical protein
VHDPEPRIATHRERRDFGLGLGDCVERVVKFVLCAYGRANAGERRGGAEDKLNNTLLVREELSKSLQTGFNDSSSKTL